MKNLSNKKPEVNDGRYNIGLEFTGAAQQQHVVRFCGDFISGHPNRLAAEVAALEHAINREQNRSGWVLVAKVENVLWLVKGKSHRVAYGADVRDFSGKNASWDASQSFGGSVHHALQCEGAI